MLTSNYSSTSSVRASILLGGMFYVVTFFELVALNTLDLNAGFFTENGVSQILVGGHGDIF